MAEEPKKNKAVENFITKFICNQGTKKSIGSEEETVENNISEKERITIYNCAVLQKRAFAITGLQLTEREKRWTEKFFPNRVSFCKFLSFYLISHHLRNLLWGKIGFSDFKQRMKEEMKYLKHLESNDSFIEADDF